MQLFENDAEKIEYRLSLLDESCLDLRKLDVCMAELCDAISDEEADTLAESEAMKAFEYADKAAACRSEAIACLKRLSPHTPSELPKPKVEVKLEKLSLPNFDGNILSFQNFWESFDSRVHSNANLNPIDKFDYLRNCCQGSAADALKPLPRTASGYQLAVDTLKRRFGRLAPVINLRLTELIELKTLEDDCTTNDLRKMLDVMLVHVPSLLSLGLHKEGGADWIGPILIARLPPRLRIRWEEKCRSDGTFGVREGLCSDLEEFLEFFYRLVEIEESTQSMSLKSKKTLMRLREKSSSSNSKPFLRKPLLSSSFNTHVHVQKCQICESNDHAHAWKCPKFLNVSLNDRRSLCNRFKLCLNCLSEGHIVKNCSSISRCRHCQGKHHTSLHGFTPRITPRTESANNAARPVETSSSASLVSDKTQSRVFLQSCKALASDHHGNSVQIRVLFDSCSTSSFILEETAKRLKLPVQESKSLSINTFGHGVVQQKFNIYQVNIGSIRGDPSSSVSLIATPNLVHPIQGQKLDLTNFSHLCDLFVPEDYTSNNSLSVDVIIGADHFYDFMTGNHRIGCRKEPVAIETTLGWTLHGSFSCRDSTIRMKTSAIVMFCQSALASSVVSDNLERLWTLEGIDAPPVKENEWVKPSLQNDRLTTALPWKSTQLPRSNREAVENLQHKLYSNLSPDQKIKRQEYFQELQDLQIIEPCTETPGPQAWYLPHHCIWKGKLRVVFDGSFGSPSINDLLLTGPNILADIPSCLTSFRLYSIPITADLEKAFLQIEVQEPDRDFLRFLVDDKCFRFCRVPFGLNCSPSILNHCLHLLYDCFHEQFPETISRLRACTYVDDIVSSFPNENSLKQFKEESVKLFNMAGMNLRGWTSSPLKILGIAYQAELDQFALPLHDHPIFISKQCSRRELLSYTASLFDPLGLALPWTIRLRILLQATWKAALTWDQDLPPEMKKVWLDISKDASFHPVIVFPRCLNFNPLLPCVLHAFSDASQKAFATCVYVVSGRHSTLLYS